MFFLFVCLADDFHDFSPSPDHWGPLTRSPQSGAESAEGAAQEVRNGGLVVWDGLGEILSHQILQSAVVFMSQYASLSSWWTKQTPSISVELHAFGAFRCSGVDSTDLSNQSFPEILQRSIKHHMMVIKPPQKSKQNPTRENPDLSSKWFSRIINHYHHHSSLGYVPDFSNHICWGVPSPSSQCSSGASHGLSAATPGEAFDVWSQGEAGGPGGSWDWGWRAVAGEMFHHLTLHV